MKKIITMLHPFDYKQTVIAYENGNKIGVEQFTLEELPSAICNYAASLNISEIELGGPEQYARGISKNIQNIAATKYAENNLQIKLLNEKGDK